MNSSSSLIFVIIIKWPGLATKSMVYPCSVLTATIRNPFIILIPIDSLLKWSLCTKETWDVFCNYLFILEPHELTKLWLQASFWSPVQPYANNYIVCIRFGYVINNVWSSLQELDWEWHTGLVFGNQSKREMPEMDRQKLELLYRKCFTSPVCNDVEPVSLFLLNILCWTLQRGNRALTEVRSVVHRTKLQSVDFFLVGYTVFILAESFAYYGKYGNLYLLILLCLISPLS